MGTSLFSNIPAVVVSSCRMKASGGSPPVALRTFWGSTREVMDREEKEWSDVEA